MSASLSLRLIEELLDKVQKEGIKDPHKINEELVDDDVRRLCRKRLLDRKRNSNSSKMARPFCSSKGVNGVGKTTSIAKLAYRYQKQGKEILLVAADTFRAGAVEQLKVWASRLNCPIVTGKENGDPASVCFDGAKYAKEHRSIL
jgi:fused signal recognition particle receptor